jgi:hypothetical protein
MPPMPPPPCRFRLRRRHFLRLVVFSRLPLRLSFSHCRHFQLIAAADDYFAISARHCQRFRLFLQPVFFFAPPPASFDFFFRLSSIEFSCRLADILRRVFARLLFSFAFILSSFDSASRHFARLRSPIFSAIFDFAGQ